MKAETLTIAHISDLHRSSDNPISNVALLSSLIHDVDIYTTQGIEKPDNLIVSRDIIQGSTDITLLKEQYDSNSRSNPRKYKSSRLSNFSLNKVAEITQNNFDLYT